MGAEGVGDQRPPPSPPADPLDVPVPESLPPELDPPEPPELDAPEPLDPLVLPELVAPEVDPPEVDPFPVPELPGPCDPPGPASLVFVSSVEAGSVVPPPLPEQPNGAARPARSTRRMVRTRASRAIMERRAASDVPCSRRRDLRQSAEHSAVTPPRAHVPRDNWNATLTTGARRREASLRLRNDGTTPST